MSEDFFVLQDYLSNENRSQMVRTKVNKRRQIHLTIINNVKRQLKLNISYQLPIFVYVVINYAQMVKKCVHHKILKAISSA